MIKTEVKGPLKCCRLKLNVSSLLNMKMQQYNLCGPLDLGVFRYTAKNCVINSIFWSNLSVLNKLSMILYYLQITDPGREKSHFFFTLRDLPEDFINVNCWGSENYIDRLSKSFRIHDIGKGAQAIA